MSTVVHFVEFIMMSLMGIMLYKLYASYMSWKNVSAFSSSICSKKQINSFKKNDNSESLLVSKVNMTLTRSVKSTVPNKVPNSTAPQNTAIKEHDVKAIEAETKASNVEKKSSAILNDYIGEFFAEHKTMDIEAFRSPESKLVKEINNTDKMSESALVATSVSNVNDNKFDDDVIKVEPLFIVSDSGSLSHSTAFDESRSSKEASRIINEENVPTLHELGDIESDSFITVASINNEIKNGNKTMSDKVVLAMLDEAKLVCAS